MLILTLPLHEKGLHQESFFRCQTYTLMQKGLIGQKVCVKTLITLDIY